MPKPRKPLLSDDTLVDPKQLSWVMEMREEARQGLTRKSIQKIVAKQVELAEAGDPVAVRFVFTQLLGLPEMKGLHLEQHNHFADPAAPSKAPPASDAKIELMRERAKRRLPLTQKAETRQDVPDADVPPGLDEEDLSDEQIEEILDDENGGQ